MAPRSLDRFIDPELRDVWMALPDVDPAMPIEERRRLTAAALGDPGRQLPVPSPVVISDVLVPALADAGRRVRCRVYRDERASGAVPGLLWAHGGGFMVGTPEMDDGFCASVAAEIAGVVVSVDYRLAPEHPFPAAVDDCESALAWMTSAASGLSLDPALVGVGGISAGGGLATSLAIRVSSAGKPALCFQFLQYPSLDDRHETPSSHLVVDPRVWNRDRSIAAWAAYLAGAAGEPEAVPATCQDVSRLPRTYILAAELDLSRDECIAYAQRLSESGVATELHVAPGAFHGFDRLAPDAAISRRIVAEFLDVIKAGLRAPIA